MTATLKTTVIQEPSSATANMTLNTSGGVTIGQNLTVAGTTSGISGRAIRSPQYLTSGTSYTTPSNCTSILVEAWGGGGGGGGAGSVATSPGGGGSGAYAIRYFDVSPSTSYTYAVGAGGAGGTSGGSNGNPGTAGGSTTFAAGSPLVTLTAGGGGGGGAGNTGTAGTAGAATNADFSFSLAGFSGANSGDGGASVFWGNEGINNTGQTAARGYGSGGAGRSSASTVGGAGLQGIIKVTEFT